MTMKDRKLGIVGHGHIGTALGNVFAKHGWDVQYYDIEPKLRTVDSLSQLAERSQIVMIAAPSRTNRAIATELAPKLKGKLLVSVAKGVEPGFITVDQVLAEVSDGAFDTGLLYGPMLAAEISNKQPASIMLATTSSKWAHTFDDIEQIKIVHTADVRSVALCGVLKNIYAIAFGVNDGLGLGINSKAALAVQIIDEFQRLLDTLGGDPHAALSLVGMGDLLATGWGQTSFNYNMGKSIAEQPASTEPKGEGVLALEELPSKVDLSDYPVAQGLHGIIFEHTQAAPVFGKLIVA